jgi:hypothetical protein
VNPQATVKRFAWALVLSLLLHALMVFGPAIQFPEYRPAPILEAVLTRAPPPSPPAATPTPRRKPMARPHPPSTAPAPEPETEAPPPPAPEETAPPAEEAIAATEPAAEPPIPLPELAEIRYTLYKGRNGLAVGKVEHTWKRDGKRYSINQVAEASGIFSFFVSGRHVQISQGEITPQGLKPASYWVQRGQCADKTDTAQFDWAEGKITFGTGGDTRTVGLPTGTQDLLSLLYQLAFAPPQGGVTELHITTGRKLGRYGYQAVGEETLDTELGEIKSLHIGQGRGEGEENTEIWLATEYHYLPVKIRFTDKQGGVMEQTATAIKVQ